MNKVLIVGAGGHGQVVADILLCAVLAGSHQVPIGFLDDDRRLVGETVLGLPVLGVIDHISRLECDGVIVAVGGNAARRRLALALDQAGYRLINAIHPSATIASDVRLELGVTVCARAVVNTGSVVGDGAILNTGCTIDHHCRIGAYAHIGPGANLGGNVEVGEGTLVGIGSAVLPGRTIGHWVVAAAGSVITKDIPQGTTVAGMPARVIKHHGREA